MKYQTKSQTLTPRGVSHPIKALKEAELSAMLALLCIKPDVGQNVDLTRMVSLIQQSPSVNIVAGFAQWRRAGRRVRKGERGSFVFMPMNENNYLFFRALYVFDIRQTEVI